MTSEQVVAVLAGITALLGAATALLIQVHLLRKDVDGRVQQLITTAAEAARKHGELEGRDFMRRLQTPPEENPPGAPSA